MKILVIGGSYFVGRVFTIKACKDYDITLLNRGKYSMKEYGVNEVVADRHSDLSKILAEYDVVVDFCAYQKNDIKHILDSLKGRVRKYIFLSTCDVYVRNDEIKDENAAYNYNTSNYPSEIKDYINGKVALENELDEYANKYNIKYTSVRPTIIYGPYNYAPRESLYIQDIVQNGQAVFPKNSDGEFQFAYVGDVADIILKICELDNIDRAYNVCSNDILNYQKFASILKQVSDIEYNEFYLDYEQINELGLYLPYPVVKEETQIYNGQKVVNNLGINYTDHAEGMQKTYNAFKNVFRR